MKEDIIAGLDIGSTEIRLVVGQRTNTGEGEKLQIIGAVAVPARGINKGVVTSIEDVTSSVTACLEKAERLVGVPIESAWVGINSPHIKCETSRGVVAVGKSDGEISPEDVERAIEAARALSVPPNYEILHVIPVKFIVDNQEDIKDPIGMTGVRLEVETLIIQALSSQVKNITKAIYRTGINIDDLVLSPLAAAEAVIEPKQKELGAAIVNIGLATTSMAVFEEGELLHTAVLPIGSEHITADLAIGLRCPLSFAEEIKLEFGNALPDKYGKKDMVDPAELAREGDSDREIKPVSRKYISEIIEARVEEIFDKIDTELKTIERSGMLPAGVFLIGRGALLEDIVEVAKKRLRLPASIGTNTTIRAVIDKVNDPALLTALGLVVWGDRIIENESALGGKIPGSKAAKESINKVVKWFKALMP